MTTKLPPARSLFSTRALVLALGCGSLAMFHVGCGGDPTMIDDPEDDGGDDDDTGSASFTAIYNSATFQECKGCHAPGAPGKVEGVEATQNWSTRDAAFTSLKRNASGLTGNQSGCNGVPLIGSSAATSLLVAALDADVRESFSVGSCDADAITDMNLKLRNDIPASLLASLKAWIDSGAPNN